VGIKRALSLLLAVLFDVGVAAVREVGEKMAGSAKRAGD